MNNKIRTAWHILLITAASILLILFVGYITVEKEFKGYYTHKYAGNEFSIWINWDNRLDEKVFQTPDYDRFLEMYAILKAEEVQK